MKKIIALMLSLLMCFAMLVSCGPDEEDPTEDPSSSTEPGQSELPSEDTDADNIVNFN